MEYDKHIPDEELAIYVAWLEDKVEDLQRSQSILHPTELDNYMKTYYVFDDRQVDAAIRMVEGLPPRHAAWLALKRLGIHRDISDDELGWVVK
jgi:hypothetical protein